MFPFAVQNATTKALRLTALGGPVSRTITKKAITTTTTATRTKTTATATAIASAIGLRPIDHHTPLPVASSSGGRRWSHSTKFRPVQVLDDWVAKEARPISLRQLMVFGRSLTEARLISSANYVRTELPTRIAHRLRDMQRLPYVVVSNPHIRDVYELYYDAFDLFRRIREIKSLDDNDRFCAELARMLRAHLVVIPKLTMGMLECSGLMPAEELDTFMSTLLRSRISRRVIAEQHLALTETFHADWFQPGAPHSESEFIGEIFLRCAAKDVIERCAKAVRDLARSANGPDVQIPEVRVDGHLESTFPYILSHLEYIVGELLRNSVQAVIDKRVRDGDDPASPPPPVEVTVCEAQKHVIIRISDRGGGIPRDVMPYLWSFAKGPSLSPARSQRLDNLGRVPLMAATLQELRVHDGNGNSSPTSPSSSSPPTASTTTTTPNPNPPTPRTPDTPRGTSSSSTAHNWASPPSTSSAPTPPSGSSSSLSPLSSRPPNLRLGMGLPLSRVYAEYWAGGLELHSLEGYGVDAFLQISKLGNKNEQLVMRASMDAI